MMRFIMLKLDIYKPLKEDQRSDTLEKLQNYEEMLIKKSEFLEKKIGTELRTAKRFSETNKKGKILLIFSSILNR